MLGFFIFTRAYVQCRLLYDMWQVGYYYRTFCTEIKLRKCMRTVTESVEPLRTLTTWHCPRIRLPNAAALRLLLTAVPPAVQRPIDISCRPGPQQQTHRRGVRRQDGTDAQTDGQTPDSCIDPATPHTIIIIVYYAEAARHTDNRYYNTTHKKHKSCKHKT